VYSDFPLVEYLREAELPDSAPLSGGHEGATTGRGFLRARWQAAGH
jgi:hypothetical protein